MKKILFFFCFVYSGLLSAQSFEVGVMAGVANYNGDLSPKSINGAMSEFHLAFGGFGRYNINQYFAARAHINYGSISADDAKASSVSQQQRNLQFRSNILEIGLAGEINFPGFQPYNLYRPFSPYIFAGISLFKFNPKAEYDNKSVALRDLGTEGQGMAAFSDRQKYSLWNLSIPFGAGVKWAITDMLAIGFEAGLRKTFTDYLDDVSTTYVNYGELAAANGELAAALSNRSNEAKVTGDGRGDPENDDWYMFFGITISHHFLDNGLMKSRRKSKRKKGCPGQF